MLTMKKHKTERQKTGTFETFRELDIFTRLSLERAEPSSFNGEVCLRKYRVTWELIDEPPDVLEARLRKMWRECKNHHHWNALHAEAEKLGIKLTHDERK